MKYHLLLTLSVSIIMISSIHSQNAFATCAIDDNGKEQCAPPPGETLTAVTDSIAYETNDVITILGVLESVNDGTLVQIQIFDPMNMMIKSYQVPANSNGKYNSKIDGNFHTTGKYKVVACIHDGCFTTYFKFIAEPYRLSVGDKTFQINYKSGADVEKIVTDIKEKSLRIHLANSNLAQMTIELPRDLMDSQSNNNDADFAVMVGERQPDKYMQKASFKEINTTAYSRTLRIDIPSDPLTNEQGIWDIKITGTEFIGVDTNILSPLEQFKSGIPIDKIQCKEGFVVAVKASNNSHVCVKPQTLKKLRERGWAESSGNIIKQRSSQTIRDLTENSDRIITGMVTDKETIGNTTMVWVGVYEWLKKNPNYDSIILDITKDSSESSLDFQKGDELLLFLKDIDLQNGHFGIFYLDSETKPEKYLLDMKEYVDSFVKPEDKGRQYLYQENENCKNITWENDSFLYCTYPEEEFRYYIPILVTVDRVKQKMLQQVSEEYFAEHFDLRRAYDTAIANGHTIPTGQDLEFDYKIGNQKFLYMVSVSENDEAYISYFHPREIQSLPYENRINELVQTCLGRGSYPIFWDSVAVSHVEKGFTPMITGGMPAIYDRYGKAVLHPTKQQFILWPETGEIECYKDMQDFGSNPIELQKRELLIDSTEFLKIKNRK